MKKSAKANSRFSEASLARFENSRMSKNVELLTLRCPAKSAERVRAYARKNRLRSAEVVDQAITEFLKGRTK